MSRLARSAVAALVAAAVCSPVAADWLLTRDGQRLETRGPWQVEGKLVVFTRTNGTLSSLRLSEVDLEASRAATAAASAPAPAPAPAKGAAKRPKPVLVLTDADVGHVLPEQAAAAAPAEDSSETKLAVASWSEINEPDSFDVQIFGTLRNGAGEPATDIALTVRLLDAAGAVLGEQPALLGAKSLAAGASTNFRAAFPGIYTFGSVTFDVSNQTMRVVATPAAGGGAAAEGQEGEPPGGGR
jgi:hypothetical protein